MDITTILKKVNIASIQSKKEELEKRMLTAHQTGENMSVLSEDLSYYSTLFEYTQKISKANEGIQQANEILNTETDPDYISMAKEDIEKSLEIANEAYNNIIRMQMERELGDPDDNKSIILEIRAGAGGEESALFASELFRMYTNFAKSMNWELSLIDASISDNGGYKEVIAQINGKNAYKYMKYEMGVHRVQRVPATESSGRIHTSTVSVAIMPEAKEIDVEIKPEDIRIDVMRASGAGGQCVNRTDSAVRITHFPSGIVVSCQETKHQDQNKEKAMALLRSRLYDKKKQEEDAKRSQMRSSQIGMSMRAEKIRTYNFPQTRITDHRVKISWHNIEEIMNGSIKDMIEDIAKDIQAKQLEEILKKQ